MALMGIALNAGVEFHGIDEKRPKASLLEEMGARTATPIYRDKKDGSTVKVGYVVSGERGTVPIWVELYRVEPWESPQ